MNNIKKYLKYKTKYLYFKNQYGKSLEEINKLIIDCDTYVSLNNNSESCVIITLIIILFFSEYSGYEFQYNLYKFATDDEEANEMLKNAETRLSYFIDNYNNNIVKINKDLIMLLQNIFTRLFIKSYIKNPNTKERITNILIKKVLQSKDKKANTGFYTHERLLILNIFSSILLNKLVNLYTKQFISINLTEINNRYENIGILLHVKSHVCCFYICNGIYKYFNNNKIINYYWPKLFEECEELTKQNKKFIVKLEALVDDNVTNDDFHGPIIYIIDENIYKILDKNQEQSESIFKKIDEYYDPEYEQDVKEIFDENTDEVLYYSIVKLHKNNNINDFKKENYYNLLIYYIRYNNFSDFKKLLNDNPDIDINKNIFDETILSTACISENINFCNLLIEIPNINIDKASIYYACYYNKISIVEKMLDINANVNIIYKNYTPLMIACYFGYADIVKLLLQQPEIDVNLFQQIEITLENTRTQGNVEVVKILEEYIKINSI
jgi:hypothetical protein